MYHHPLSLADDVDELSHKHAAAVAHPSAGVFYCKRLGAPHIMHAIKPQQEVGVLKPS